MLEPADLSGSRPWMRYVFHLALATAGGFFILFGLALLVSDFVVFVAPVLGLLLGYATNKRCQDKAGQFVWRFPLRSSLQPFAAEQR